MMMKDVLFVEKYRPRTIQETILPVKTKNIFQTFVDNKEIPNLILCGSSGNGKTTSAKAMLNEVDCEYLVINASLNADMDTLRNKISRFASSLSLRGGRKYVILDEGDSLTGRVQSSLRNFMEEYSKNCGFIFTCNYKNRIIPALHSRCSVIDFVISKTDKVKMASAFFKRCCEILVKENIDFDKAAVAGLLKEHFPDFRRVLNELQSYGSSGKIDSGILISTSIENFKTLTDIIKGKQFKEMRKWVAQNSDIEPANIFRKFYDSATEFLTPNSIPHLVVLIGDYQYKAAFVVDQEINLASFFTMIMAEEDIEFV